MPKMIRFSIIVAVVAGAWSLSSFGYFTALPILGASVG
jgi:hypothetical protein